MDNSWEVTAGQQHTLLLSAAATRRSHGVCTWPGSCCPYLEQPSPGPGSVCPGGAWYIRSVVLMS